MKTLVYLFLVLALTFSACQKLPLPSADIKEPKDKVKYTQAVRETTPDQTN